LDLRKELKNNLQEFTVGWTSKVHCSPMATYLARTESQFIEEFIEDMVFRT